MSAQLPLLVKKYTDEQMSHLPSISSSVDAPLRANLALERFTPPQRVDLPAPENPIIPPAQNIIITIIKNFFLVLCRIFPWIDRIYEALTHHQNHQAERLQHDLKLLTEIANIRPDHGRFTIREALEYVTTILSKEQSDAPESINFINRLLEAQRRCNELFILHEQFSLPKLAELSEIWISQIEKLSKNEILLVPVGYYMAGRRIEALLEIKRTDSYDSLTLRSFSAALISATPDTLNLFDGASDVDGLRFRATRRIIQNISFRMLRCAIPRLIGLCTDPTYRQYAPDLELSFDSWQQAFIDALNFSGSSLVEQEAVVEFTSDVELTHLDELVAYASSNGHLPNDSAAHYDLAFRIGAFFDVCRTHREHLQNEKFRILAQTTALSLLQALERTTGVQNAQALCHELTELLQTIANIAPEVSFPKTGSPVSAPILLYAPPANPQLITANSESFTFRNIDTPLVTLNKENPLQTFEQWICRLQSLSKISPELAAHEAYLMTQWFPDVDHPIWNNCTKKEAQRIISTCCTMFHIIIKGYPRVKNQYGSLHYQLPVNIRVAHEFLCTYTARVYLKVYPHNLIAKLFGIEHFYMHPGSIYSFDMLSCMRFSHASPNIRPVESVKWHANQLVLDLSLGNLRLTTLPPLESEKFQRALRDTAPIPPNRANGLTELQNPICPKEIEQLVFSRREMGTDMSWPKQLQSFQSKINSLYVSPQVSRNSDDVTTAQVFSFSASDLMWLTSLGLTQEEAKKIIVFARFHNRDLNTTSYKSSILWELFLDNTHFIEIPALQWLFFTIQSNVYFTYDNSFTQNLTKRVNQQIANCIAREKWGTAAFLYQTAARKCPQVTRLDENQMTQWAEEYLTRFDTISLKQMYLLFPILLDQYWEKFLDDPNCEFFKTPRVQQRILAMIGRLELFPHVSDLIEKNQKIRYLALRSWVLTKVQSSLQPDLVNDFINQIVLWISPSLEARNLQWEIATFPILYANCANGRYRLNLSIGQLELDLGNSQRLPAFLTCHQGLLKHYGQELFDGQWQGYRGAKQPDAMGFVHARHPHLRILVLNSDLQPVVQRQIDGMWMNLVHFPSQSNYVSPNHDENAQDIPILPWNCALAVGNRKCYVHPQGTAIYVMPQEGDAPYAIIQIQQPLLGSASQLLGFASPRIISMQLCESNTEVLSISAEYLRSFSSIEEPQYLLTTGRLGALLQIEYSRYRIVGSDLPLIYDISEDQIRCQNFPGYILKPFGTIAGLRNFDAGTLPLPRTFTQYQLLEKQDRQKVLIPMRRISRLQTRSKCQLPQSERAPLFGVEACPVFEYDLDPQSNRLRTQTAEGYMYLAYLYCIHWDYANAAVMLQKARTSAGYDKRVSQILSWIREIDGRGPNEVAILLKWELFAEEIQSDRALQLRLVPQTKSLTDPIVRKEKLLRIADLYRAYKSAMQGQNLLALTVEELDIVHRCIEELLHHHGDDAVEAPLPRLNQNGASPSAVVEQQEIDVTDIALKLWTEGATSESWRTVQSLLSEILQHNPAADEAHLLNYLELRIKTHVTGALKKYLLDLIKKQETQFRDSPYKLADARNAFLKVRWILWWQRIFGSKVSSRNQALQLYERALREVSSLDELTLRNRVRQWHNDPTADEQLKQIAVLCDRYFNLRGRDAPAWMRNTEALAHRAFPTMQSQLYANIPFYILGFVPTPITWALRILGPVILLAASNGVFSMAWNATLGIPREQPIEKFIGNQTYGFFGKQLISQLKQLFKNNSKEAIVLPARSPAQLRLQQSSDVPAITIKDRYQFLQPPHEKRNVCRIGEPRAGLREAKPLCYAQNVSAKIIAMSPDAPYFVVREERVLSEDSFFTNFTNEDFSRVVEEHRQAFNAHPQTQRIIELTDAKATLLHTALIGRKDALLMEQRHLQAAVLTKFESFIDLPLYQRTALRYLGELEKPTIDTAVGLWRERATVVEFNQDLNRNILQYILCTIELQQIGNALTKLASWELEKNASALESLYDTVQAQRHFSIEDPDGRDLLFLEYIEKLILRRQQVEVFREMIQNPCAARQLRMGDGKSKVLLPLLAKSKANGENLVIVLLPEELYETNCRDLEQTNRNLFGQVMHRFDFSRRSDTSPETMTSLHQRLCKTIDSRGYILSTKRSLLAFRNSYVLLLTKAGDKTLSRVERENVLGSLIAMGRIAHLLLHHADVIADEIHACLDIRKEVNFSMGDPTPIDSIKIQVGSNLLRLIMESDDVELHGLAVDLRHNSQAAISNETKRKLLKRLAVVYLTRYNIALDAISQDDLVEYLTEKVTDDNELRSRAVERTVLALELRHSNLFQEIASLKAFLQRGFATVLSRVGNVHFGRDPISRQWTIPYKANNTPHIGSEFDDDIEKICFTLVDYLQNGVSKELITILVEQWLSEAQKQLLLEKKTNPLSSMRLDQTTAARQYQKFMQNIGIAQAPQLELIVEKENIEALICHINTHARQTFAEKIVLPQIKQYPLQIHSTSLDVPDIVKNFGGFTGTPWNLHSYHDKITPTRNLPVDGSTWAIMLNRRIDIQVFEFDPLSPSESLLQVIDIPSHRYQALIDAGAYLRGIENQEFIAHCCAQGANAGIYFDATGRIVKKTRESGDILPLESAAHTALNRNFTLYDHPHIVGADIAQAPDAQALVTIGENTFISELFQAVWRLRSLDKGQTISFAVSQKVQKQILKKSDRPLTTTDILQFCVINEAMRESEDNFRAERQAIESMPKRAALSHFTNQIQQGAPNRELILLAEQFSQSSIFTKTRPLGMPGYRQYAAIQRLTSPITVLSQSVDQAQKLARNLDSFSELRNMQVRDFETRVYLYPKLVGNNEENLTEVEAETLQEAEAQTETEQEIIQIAQTGRDPIFNGPYCKLTWWHIKCITDKSTDHSGFYLLRDLHASLPFFDDNIYVSENLERQLLPIRACLISDCCDPCADGNTYAKWKQWFSEGNGTHHLAPQSVYYSNRVPAFLAAISYNTQTKRWTMILPSLHDGLDLYADADRSLPSSCSFQLITISATNKPLIIQSLHESSLPKPDDDDARRQFMRLYIQAKLYNGEIHYPYPEEQTAICSWLHEVGKEEYQGYFEEHILPSLSPEKQSSYRHSFLYRAFTGNVYADLDDQKENEL